MATGRGQAAAVPTRIREIRTAIAVFAVLFVLWWVVEFITYAGRSGGIDAFDFLLVPIVGIGGWLVYRAWRMACPRCSNPFFVNSSLPLGVHFSEQCPYCGFSIRKLPEAQRPE